MTQSSNARKRSDQTRVLLLTRPEKQSLDFLAECEAALNCSIPAVISPILVITPVKFSINLDRYRTLIFTSRNAVEQFGSRLENRYVVTVGAQTAKLASDYGASASCLGQDVDTLLERKDEIASPAVHLRGVHSRGRLAERLSDFGVLTDECVVYDQVEQQLSGEGKAALRSGCAVVPVFSPRSAAVLSAYDAHPDTRVAAISEAARNAWSAPGLCDVARHPERQAMRDLVIAAL